MTREQLASRIAALCLIAGSTCVLLVRVSHGDLPTDTGEEALRFVAARPLYSLIHFGDWLGVLVWTGGLVAFSASLNDRTAWVLGRLGAASALVAQSQMGVAWRAGINVSEQHGLVRRGLFSVVRNPFYLGMITASFGVALMVPNIAALVGWAAVTVGCEIDVRLVEEPHLRAVHGEVFAAYQRSTPRFVPRLPSSGRR